MLTITRKIGDQVTITHGDETIDIIVTDIRQGQIRLSFDGPLTFQVARDDAIKDVNGNVYPT